MKVSSVGLLNYASKVKFGEEEAPKKAAYENPISRSTEKALATLSVIGGSAVLGAIVAGLASCLKPNAKFYVPVGVITAIVATALTLPSKLYNTAVSAFTREKEMDVFSRDKALKTTLTEEVHKEVLDPEVSLDKKLEDNLKLQMANKGQGIVVR